jgi:hypothetical protein
MWCINSSTVKPPLSLRKWDQYCKPTYFRGYYVSRFSASRQFRGDLISR